jgi:hypothetical protein
MKMFVTGNKYIKSLKINALPTELFAAFREDNLQIIF